MSMPTSVIFEETTICERCRHYDKRRGWVATGLVRWPRAIVGLDAIVIRWEGAWAIVQCPECGGSGIAHKCTAVFAEHCRGNIRLFKLDGMKEARPLCEACKNVAEQIGINPRMV